MNATSENLQCASHPHREAAARCASCSDFFCRECITEHDLQMLCAPCLRKKAEAGASPKKRRRGLLAPFVVLAQLSLGIILVWFAFYLFGRLVIAIPADFHEGTLWGETQPNSSE